MNNAETYDSLHAEIRRGSTRYRSARAATDLRAKIEEFRLAGGGKLADWLDLLLDQEFTLQSIDELINHTKQFLANEPVPVRAKLDALVLLAKLTSPTESYEASCDYRRQARDLARSERRTQDEFVILVNWLAAAIEAGRLNEAQVIADQVDSFSGELPPAGLAKLHQTEAWSRFLTHKAKILFKQSIFCSDERRRSGLIDSAVELYKDAISREAESDHGRSNLQIELAFKLIEQSLAHSQSPLLKAGEMLAEAEQSLNSHHCHKCQGYYHHARAWFHLTVGNKARRHSLLQATEEWRTALRHVGQCRENYARAGFPTQKVDSIAKESEKRMADAASPRKIFLSHKTADKNIVRDFKATLQDLGFDPWLDDDAMAAGENLERALLKGFKDSCGVVFFITPNYIDEGFLETEVNYAIKEKRDKGARFAIVTLDLPDVDGNSGVVPELLKQYVWKKPQSHLHALREVLRALPLELGNPDWK